MTNETKIPDSLPFAALTVEQASHLIGEIITKELSRRPPVEPPPRNEVMNIAAAGAFLGECGYSIRKGSLYNLVAAKAIPHGKIGKRLIFRRSELTEWVASRTRPDKNKSDAAVLLCKTVLRQTRKGLLR